MGKKKDAWFPFYIGDYLRDTGNLTTEQHGAYLLLLIHHWARGPIPDDDRQLMAIARLLPSAWESTRPVLAPLFQIEGGHWRHKRVEAEKTKALGISSKRAEAGRAGAGARWPGDSNCHPDAIVLPKQSDAPSQSQSQSPKEREPAAATAGGDPAPAGPAAAAADAGQVVELRQDALPGPDQWRPIIQAFDAARVEAFGADQARPWPQPDDRQHAIRFLQAGADLEMCQAVFGAIMQRQRAAGAGAPNSLGYMAQPIANAIAGAQRPMPKGNAADAPRQAFNVDQFLERAAAQ